MKAQTTDTMRAALQPTRHPHPLLVADAVAQTAKAAEESADRYIADQHPHVAALLNDGAREHTDDQGAEAELAALVAEHGLDVEVLDPSTLSENLRNKVTAFHAEHLDGTRVLCVVDGQDPTHLLETVRHLLDKAEQALTVPQVTLTLDEGLGAHRTTPIETALRDIDCEAERRDLPWLAAEVVVFDDKPQAYGRKTRVWLHNGSTTGELTPSQGREALVAMREFADRYEVLLDLADETAAGDFEGDPEIAAADRQAEARA
ncbi:hypothetical protein [Streptomyces sp. NBC_00620]|uniref:hypothetical protein n=1 Tax=Streptomyces sp. NBC_00620 TaxID=2903666 RepID=UPI00224D2784|nr:hypothetical protein [Streptomyces sp. NBC_00620]MCX4972178.1 hypothetical protein [Streptomyces sp. NBC_00620]